MSSNIEATEVFTPNKPPIEEHNIYIHREEFERRLSKAFRRGSTPVIFGDYGVGKTSLSLKTLANLMQGTGHIVRITSPANMDISDVYKRAFETLGYKVSVSETTTKTRGWGGGVEASVGSDVGISGFLKLLNVSGRGSAKADLSRSEQEVRQFLVSSPTDEKAIEIFSQNHIVFLVDELHHATDRLKEQISAAVKSCSDQGMSYPKFVLCGTSSDAESIAAINRGVDRLITEIKVIPLTSEESKEIVRKGFEALGVSCEEDLPDKIAQVAGGAPSLVHSIALELADAAIEEERPVGESDLMQALDEVIHQGQNERMLAQYNKAINHKGVKRYRKHILTVMARSSETYVTTGELAEGVSSILGLPVEQHAISGPLRELKSEEYGSILSNPLKFDGSEQQNQSCFSQPQMKSYINFLLKVEDFGVNVADPNME